MGYDKSNGTPPVEGTGRIIGTLHLVELTECDEEDCEVPAIRFVLAYCPS
jgi:hypothetical protein